MILILLSCFSFLLFSLVNIFLPSHYRRINAINSFLSLSASLTGLLGAAAGLATRGSFLAKAVRLSAGYLYFDYLSHFFLLVLFLVLSAVSVYGAGYLKKLEEKKPVNFLWFNFHLLAFSMCGVLLSRNAVLFLLFWEMMAFSSFFLVMTDYKNQEVRKAGLIYICANGAGALLLIVAFALIADSNYNFSAISLYPSVVFFLSLAGFGLKAGFVPLHVWLPEAHPAAPGNVSALMSGVMIKMGIYGILRALSWLHPWKESWGWTILAMGAASALLGVILALGQRELKKLLAYSSVENIGIILIAIGLSVLLSCAGYSELSMATLCAALFHVFNHSLFKSLLFMSAGSIQRAVSHAGLEELGGLLNKMPFTSFFFLTGSAAAAGLPPLNGFSGEFIIYYAAFASLGFKAGAFSVFAILALSIAGALALAAFTKAFSAIFQGMARSEKSSKAAESSPYMIYSMGFLSFICILTGFVPYFSFKFLFSSLSPVFFQSETWNLLSKYFALITGAYISVLLFFAVLYYMRKRIFSENVVSQGAVWDCGYLEPSPRARYGAASFSQPLTEFFSFITRPSSGHIRLIEFFPRSATYSRNPGAIFYDTLYMPAAGKIRKTASRFSFIQSGRLRFYVLYIFLTLVVLLIWKI